MRNEKVFIKTEEEWESDGVLSSPSAETEHLSCIYLGYFVCLCVCYNWFGLFRGLNQAYSCFFLGGGIHC
jgi:hypothetical protein